jgi:hypothetical protein
LDDSELKLQTLEYYACEKPDVPVRLNGDEVKTGMSLSSPGGLLVAEAPGYRATSIAAAPLILKGFSGLALDVQLRSVIRNSADIMRRLEIITRWGVARLQGAQQASGLWRDRIVGQMLHQLIATILGENWRRAEEAVRSGKVDVDDLIDCIGGKPQQAMLDLVQILHLNDLGPFTVTQKLARICRRCLADDCFALAGQVKQTLRNGKVRRVDQSAWTFQYALRLCSAPHTLLDWAGDRAQLGMEQLLNHPRVLRAARYVHLALSLPSRHGPARKEQIWIWE